MWNEISCLDLYQQKEIIILKKTIMTIQELNIANALYMAKSLIREMIEANLIEAKYLYGVAKAISVKYDINMDNSIMIVENATALVLSK